MFPDEAKAQIFADFGEPIQRDIVQIVGRAYPRANKSAHDRYCQSVARDFYPIERRAMIENSLPLLTNRYPQIQVTPERNKKGTSSYYQIAHNQTVLTQSKTEGRGQLPRDANFRRTLAQTPQMVFEQYRDLIPSLSIEAIAVYGIVAHGPMENDPAELGFIEILIPDQSGTQVLAAIDLFSFWNAGQGPVVFPTQPITPVAPTLKIVSGKTDESTGA